MGLPDSSVVAETKALKLLSPADVLADTKQSYSVYGFSPISIREVLFVTPDTVLFSAPGESIAPSPELELVSSQYTWYWEITPLAVCGGAQEINRL